MTTGASGNVRTASGEVTTGASGNVRTASGEVTTGASGNVRTASGEVTADPRTGCCAGQPAGSFTDRVAAGRRRRIALWRIQLAASAALTLAAIALTAAGRLAPAALEPRLAWASSVMAAGLVLGWLRQALATRQPGWRLIVSAAAVAAGIAWQPLVPAVVATSVLAERLIRGTDPAGTAAGSPAGAAG